MGYGASQRLFLVSRTIVGGVDCGEDVGGGTFARGDNSITDVIGV